ncbi:hypothetical protein [Methylomonas koyamae]|uniref:hypothetical protein n=1 Tax=Methylomonas koyamae TaxID=702114 RepID=UPI002873B3C8|nr:hypothetical protein [Methylomonas koyamae]WNB74577.1 hypothetical protein RI210_14945 [Methylomonas koyamae]
MTVIISGGEVRYENDKTEKNDYSYKAYLNAKRLDHDSDAPKSVNDKSNRFRIFDYARFLTVQEAIDRKLTKVGGGKKTMPCHWIFWIDRREIPGYFCTQSRIIRVFHR